MLDVRRSDNNVEELRNIHILICGSV